MEGLNLSKIVSTKQEYLWQSPTETNFDVRKDIQKCLQVKIVAIDFEQKINFK